MSKLGDLNTHLFDVLGRLSNTDLTKDQLDLEVKRSSAIVDVADQITNNSKTQLAAAKLYAEHGAKMLPMLPKIGGSQNDEGKGNTVDHTGAELDQGPQDATKKKGPLEVLRKV